MAAAQILPPQIVPSIAETTGLGAASRIVTLAAIPLDTASPATDGPRPMRTRKP